MQLLDKIQVDNELKYLTDINELFSRSHHLFFSPFKKKFVIDLTDLRFVSPIGAISLLLYFEKLGNLNNFKVIPPKDNKNLITYIERINFFKHCPSEITTEFSKEYNLEKISGRRRHDKRKVMLEITEIKVYEDIDILFDSVLYILNSHEMNGEQVSRIASIVSELGTNIIDHSDGSGYGAIQYYPKFKKVMIGIADNGVGIVNKIKKYENSDDTDLNIVKKAFSEGYTSFKDIERGWGLTEARDHSHENTESTSFQLRTQNSVYEIRKQEIIELDTSEYFPGTYFLIEIIFKS